MPAAAGPIGQSDNLIARIAEAERESWPGEVEGFQVNLAGAEDKLNGSTTRHMMAGACERVASFAISDSVCR